MVWLSGTEKSFAHAEKVMQRIGHMVISDSSIWRRKEEWGARLQQLEEEQCNQANTGWCNVALEPSHGTLL